MTLCQTDWNVQVSILTQPSRAQLQTIGVSRVQHVQHLIVTRDLDDTTIHSNLDIVMTDRDRGKVAECLSVAQDCQCHCSWVTGTWRHLRYDT